MYCYGCAPDAPADMSDICLDPHRECNITLWPVAAASFDFSGSSDIIYFEEKSQGWLVNKSSLFHL